MHSIELLWQPSTMATVQRSPLSENWNPHRPFAGHNAQHISLSH
jgi:hypothetical protein